MLRECQSIYGRSSLVHAGAPGDLMFLSLLVRSHRAAVGHRGHTETLLIASDGITLTSTRWPGVTAMLPVRNTPSLPIGSISSRTV